MAKLLEEQERLQDELLAAEPTTVGEEQAIADSPDKLQRFLAQCSKVSQKMRDSPTKNDIQEARRYFRKLIYVGGWLMLAEIKRHKDDTDEERQHKDNGGQR